MKANKLTTGDLQAISDLLDKQTAVLATKEELKDSLAAQTIELKAYMDEGIDTVMNGIDNIAKGLAEKERVEKIEHWARKAGNKIGIEPNF
jgi:hypothetical protein